MLHTINVKAIVRHVLGMMLGTDAGRSASSEKRVVCSSPDHEQNEMDLQKMSELEEKFVRDDGSMRWDDVLSSVRAVLSHTSSAMGGGGAMLTVTG